jgi:hypothetical protein
LHEEEKVYTIGKGKLLFRQTGETNFRDLGNAPDFKIATGIEKKPHFSSREGTKTKDDEAVIQQTEVGSFTLDDLTDENLKMHILSNAITDVVQSQGTLTAQAATPEMDRWIELDKRKLSNVEVGAVEPEEEWTGAADYELGDFVLPELPNGYRFECTTAGTPGGEVISGTPYLIIPLETIMKSRMFEPVIFCEKVNLLDSFNLLF